MEINLILLITIGGLVGAASGYLGSFMILKRMSLVGDALSHVALPGVATALLFGFDPILGAISALMIAVLGIWYLGEKTKIYSETLVGIFFTASLAIGILVTPEHELLEALFGNLEKIGFMDGIFTILISIIIYLLTKKISKDLLLGVVSEDLAASTGINTPKINLIYLILVGLTVALGVKFVGTLLMGALVIVPAAAAKNFAKNMSSFQLYSSVIGGLSVILGILLSRVINISSGPAVVLVSVAFFGVSYLFETGKYQKT